MPPATPRTLLCAQSDCSLVAGCLQEPRGQGGDPLQLLPTHLPNQEAPAGAQESQTQRREGGILAHSSPEHGPQCGSVLLLSGSSARSKTSAATFLLSRPATATKVRGLPRHLPLRARPLQALPHPLAVAHHQPRRDAARCDQGDR